MKKTFCDSCEGEMPAEDQGRFKRKLGDIQVEVIVTYQGVANSGDICPKCVQEAIVRGEKASP